jgi:hypothetical protein
MEIFKHVNMSFLKNVRIRGQTPLSAFIVEIIKAIVKKKRTLTFYTLHTLFYDKKRIFFYRMLGWHRSVISCSSTNGAV